MSDLEEKFNEINNTADTTAEFDQQDIEQNKIFAILAYISWLVLIPMLVAKDSKFAKYHANQGLVLAIAEIICFAIIGLLGKLPLIGLIFRIIESLLGLVCVLFSVLGIVNAANGKAKELPFVGSFRLLK